MWRVAFLFLAMTCVDLTAQNSSAPASNAPPATGRVEQGKLGPAFRAACWKGDLATVIDLYDKGAPIEGQDNQNRTPLFLACHGDHDVVSFLLSHGARIDAPEKGGDMPITHACQYGDLASAKLLLTAGANVNVVNDSGQTPLMLAAQEGHDDLVSFLIDQHVDVNFESKSDPALFFATWTDHPSTAQLLLEAGAHLTYSPAFAASKSGRLPILSMAVQTKDPVIVDLLLAHGADINSPSADGETPLMRAAQAGGLGMLDHLVDKGADVNRQDKEGRTALMLSVNYQQPPALEYLLDHGAHIDACDNRGRTALVWACLAVYNPVIRFLIEKGADINVADSANETPLTYAADRGDEEMVQLLRDKGVKRTIVHVIAKKQPNPPLPSSRAWALAVGAIYPQTNGLSPDLLGYDDDETTEMIQQSLKKDWNVKDKASFVQCIKDLEADGPRSDEQKKVEDLAVMTDDDFEKKMAVLDRIAPQARATRKSFLRWKEKSGVAWDLCRAANLINRGYNAHYLGEQEAWGLLMDNAKKTQAVFGSWQEMSDNFLDGREMWATDRDPKFEACARLLLAPGDLNSPWNKLPWKTDLSGN